MQDAQEKTVALLMVSGGSDSVAMLELACACAERLDVEDELVACLRAALGDPERCELRVLHVNHLLRGAESDADEAFVRRRCEELGVPLEVRRVDVARMAKQERGGMEAVARAARYRAARETLDRALESSGADDGIILTAHTLDDRVETFLMRALVGTGPGGLASIPRQRGRLRRPLLDVTREQLRDWLRRRHPDSSDDELWREDMTNQSGENFRSRVRASLVPVMRELRPGFERSLAQTMDLIADEDETLQHEADSIVYRSLEWDGSTARLPVNVLARASRPQARRILRSCLLVVDPEARLEARQIDRVLDNLDVRGYATDVSGALRIRIDDDAVKIVAARCG